MGFIWLTLGYLWSWIFPLNKNIWTSSFSLFTGGLASMIFGFCYWFIDVKGHKKGVNWGIAYGINAITIFFLSGIIARIMSMIQITVDGNIMSLKGFLYSEVLKGIFTDGINNLLTKMKKFGSLGFYFLSFFHSWSKFPHKCRFDYCL